MSVGPWARRFSFREQTGETAASNLARGRGLSEIQNRDHHTVGSTEQHGPVGMIGTDAICAEAVAVRVADTAKALLAPTLTLGQAQFNLSFPDYLAACQNPDGFDLVTWWRHWQGRASLISTSSMATAAILLHCRLPLQDLYRDLGGDLRCRIRSWWDNPSVAELVVRNFGDGEGLMQRPAKFPSPAVLHAVGSAERPTNIETFDTASSRP